MEKRLNCGMWSIPTRSAKYIASTFVVDEDNVYRHRGAARVFTSEQEAVRAIKGLSDNPVKSGDVLILIGAGPSGTGMEEIYQVTAALKFIPWGKTVTVLTDARFSGVSTGACIGHIGPEALSGGPIGRVQDGDVIEIEINRDQLVGHVRLIATIDGDLTADAADSLLQDREPHPDLQSHPQLSDDTRLWAALQGVSGGTWAGCVYDVDKIVDALKSIE